MNEKRSARAKAGAVIRRQAHGDAHVDHAMSEADDFMMMFHNVTDEFCWGTIWARPGLDMKTRAMLSLAITASHSQTGAVKLHTKTCLRAGWSKQQIGEALLHVYCYAGVYASLSGFLSAKEAFAEVDGKRRKSAAGEKRRQPTTSWRSPAANRVKK